MRKHFLILMLMALLPLSGFAADFTKASVTVGDLPFDFDDTEVKIISVVLNQQTLDDADYEWEPSHKFYSNAALTAEVARENMTIGSTYYIAVRDKTGQHTGLASGAFLLKKIPLTISFTATEQVYGAAATAITPTIKDRADHAISSEIRTLLGVTVGREAGTDAGSYAFTFTYNQNTNYEVLRKEGETTKYTITPKDINDLADFEEEGEAVHAFNMTAAESYKYNGLEQAPAFTVYDGSTTKLVTVDVKWVDQATAFNFNDTDNKIDDYNVNENADKPIEANLDGYNYYAMLIGTGNYKGRVVNAGWKFAIGKKTATIVIKKQEKIYDKAVVNRAALDNTQIIYRSLEARDAEASVDNFGNTVSLYFKGHVGTEDQNTYAVTDKGTYKVVAVAADNTKSIVRNYDIDWTVEGDYVIKARPVKVTALEVKYELESQTLKDANDDTKLTSYDGVATHKALHLNNTYAKKWLQYTKEDGTLVKGNISIEALDAENNRGAVVTDTATIMGYLDMWMAKNAYAASGDNKGNYFLTKAANTGNYDITLVAGNVNVTKKGINVLVDILRKQYGDAVNDEDFSYYADGKELSSVAYNITTLDGNPVDRTKTLGIGTYLVNIDKDHTTVKDADKYEVKSWEPGYLVISKKKLTIEINTLAMNTGDTKATLNKYATVKPYTTVTPIGATKAEEIVFEFQFTADAAGSLNGPTLTATADVAEGITGYAFDEDDVDEFSNPLDIKDNAHYEITFKVGKILVLGVNDLFLNDQDPALANKILDKANKNCNIKFSSRELKRETWSAMVLPFETSVTEISGALGYAVVDVLDQTKSGSDVYLKLHMGKIPANTPFIVKYYKEDVEDDPTTELVDESEDNSTLDIAEAFDGVFAGRKVIYNNVLDEDDPDYTGANVSVADQAGNLFVGTYEATPIWGANYKAITASGKINDASSLDEESAKKYPVGALRAYFKLMTAEARIFIEEPDGTTTVIEGITVEKMAAKPEGWYTLNGVKLNGVPTEKGIYINNGKKVVIK